MIVDGRVGFPLVPEVSLLDWLKDLGVYHSICLLSLLILWIVVEAASMIRFSRVLVSRLTSCDCWRISCWLIS